MDGFRASLVSTTEGRERGEIKMRVKREAGLGHVRRTRTGGGLFYFQFNFLFLCSWATMGIWVGFESI